MAPLTPKRSMNDEESWLWWVGVAANHMAMAELITKAGANNPELHDRLIQEALRTLDTNISLYLNMRDSGAWPKPWTIEPDRLAFTYRGVDCLIKRVWITRALAGYAAIEPGHPLFGLDYEEIDKAVNPEGAQRPLIYADNHPPPDEPGDGRWWVGFYCAQVTLGDFLPALHNPVNPGELVYRNIAYVKNQLRHLVNAIIRIRNVQTGSPGETGSDPRPTQPDS